MKAFNSDVVVKRVGKRYVNDSRSDITLFETVTVELHVKNMTFYEKDVLQN